MMYTWYNKPFQSVLNGSGTPIKPFFRRGVRTPVVKPTIMSIFPVNNQQQIKLNALVLSVFEINSGRTQII